MRQLSQVPWLAAAAAVVLHNSAAAADLPPRCAAPMPVESSRRLTSREIIYFATIFGNHLDYSKIRLSRRSIPEPFRFAGGYTKGNRIYVSALRYRSDYTRYRDPSQFWMDDVATVVRELCHVWQYQTKSAGFSTAALLAEHLKYKFDVYNYQISDHPNLKQYRYEQQCQIAFDFLYVRSFSDPDLPSYIAVVRDGLNPDDILPITAAKFRVPSLLRPR
jgi:hypothetical protein